MVKITDNSGIRSGRCILLKPYSRKKGTKPAAIIKFTAKNIKNNKKYSKGSINKGILVRTKKMRQRDTGFAFRCEDNAVIMLDNKNVPIASRINGIIFRELKYFDLYPKIILMTKTKL
jgi:large subunit ribosomal protein L14